MGQHIEIIPINSEYLPITYWWRNCNRHYFFYDKVLSPEEHIQFIEEITSSKKKWLYVIKHKDTPVGTIGLVEKRKDFAEINWVLLAEKKYRGMGIMEEAFNQLFAKHKYMMYNLSVKGDNKRAINFYKKIGFYETLMSKEKYMMLKNYNEQLNSPT